MNMSVKRRMPDRPRVETVSCLPDWPEPYAHYCFNGIYRLEVTQFNHGLHKYPATFIPQVARWALGYARTSGEGVRITHHGPQGLKR